MLIVMLGDSWRVSFTKLCCEATVWFEILAKKLPDFCKTGPFLEKFDL